MATKENGIHHPQFQLCVRAIRRRAKYLGMAIRGVDSADFKGIGQTVAEAIKRCPAGQTIKQSVIYVPTRLVTAQNAKE